MNLWWRKLASAGALIGAAGIILLFASPTYRQGEPSIVGKMASDFSYTLEGRPAKLSDLRGKVVVLNFWATWCPPCVEEIPALNRLHQQISPKGGVVLGISVDTDGAAYEKFLLDHQVRFPTYRDPAKSIASTYGTAMYPETYVIDPAGKIVKKIIGPQNWDNQEIVSWLTGLNKNN